MAFIVALLNKYLVIVYIIVHLFKTISMPDKNILLQQVGETGSAFIDVLSKFTEQSFNTIPFEGSWTAGQVAEHVYKSSSGTPMVLTAETATTGRNPEEKVAVIESIFLDFSTKMKSPDFILPSDDRHDKAQLIQDMENTVAEIIRLTDTLDLTATCKMVEFPGIGYFTRWEWISFFVCHTKRHTHQLQNIYSKKAG